MGGAEGEGQGSADGAGTVWWGVCGREVSVRYGGKDESQTRREGKKEPTCVCGRLREGDQAPLAAWKDIVSSGYGERHYPSTLCFSVSGQEPKRCVAVWNNRVRSTILMLTPLGPNATRTTLTLLFHTLKDSIKICRGLEGLDGYKRCVRQLALSLASV